VVTPISNDKILPSDDARSAVSEKKQANQGAITSQGESNASTISQEDNGVETSSVDVERANQIYSQSASQLTSGEEVVTSPEQAKTLATEIRAQIEQDGLQALRAQTGAASNSLSALLEAAPA